MSWADPTSGWRTKDHWDQFLAACWERMIAVSNVPIGTVPPYGPPPTGRLYNAGTDFPALSVQRATVYDDADPDPGSTPHPFGARTIANLQRWAIDMVQPYDTGNPYINPAVDLTGSDDPSWTQVQAATAIGLQTQGYYDPRTTADPATLPQLFQRDKPREIYTAGLYGTPPGALAGYDVWYFLDYATASWTWRAGNYAADGQRALWFDHNVTSGGPHGRCGGVTQYSFDRWYPVLQDARNASGATIIDPATGDPLQAPDPTLRADVLSSEADPLSGNWCPAGIAQPGDYGRQHLWVQLKAALKLTGTALFTAAYSSGSPLSGPLVNHDAYQGIARTVTFFGTPTGGGDRVELASASYAAGDDALGDDTADGTMDGYERIEARYVYDFTYA